MTQTIGELLAILGAVCGGTSSMLYNKLGKKVSSDVLACIRMFIAAPIMCCYALLVDGVVLPSIDSHTLIIIIISGVIGFFVTDVFLFRSYVLWGARETLVVVCLTPVFSGIAATFIFNEVLTVKQIIGSLCSLSGVIIMTLGDKSKGSKIISAGAIFALLAALFQTVADLTAKSVLVDLPWRTIAAIRGTSGAIAWLVFRMFRRKVFVQNRSVVRNPRFLSLLAVTATIGTVIGTTVVMGALKYAPVGIVSSLKQMSPVYILIIEFVFMKKHLSVTDVVGTLVSVFGVFLVF